jgi:hypothetical protein
MRRKSNRGRLAAAAALALCLTALPACGGGAGEAGEVAGDGASATTNTATAAAPSLADSDRLFSVFREEVAEGEGRDPSELTRAEQDAAAEDWRSRADRIAVAAREATAFPCVESLATTYVSYTRLVAQWFQVSADGESVEAELIDQRIRDRSDDVVRQAGRCRTAVDRRRPSG